MTSSVTSSLTSALSKSGVRTFVTSWLFDVVTVYKIGITRTATILTALALGNVVIGGVMIALDKRESLWRGYGLWTGFILVICGVTCLIMRQKRPDNRISVLSITCVIGFLTSLVCLVTSGVNLWFLYGNGSSRYPEYMMSLPEYKISLCTMNVLLLGLSFLEAVLLCLSLCLSIGYKWPCARESRSSIFTIMTEESQDDRILASDGGTEMSAFSVSALNNNNNGQRAL